MHWRCFLATLAGYRVTISPAAFVKTISVVTVPIFLVTLIAGPAEALSAETAFFVAFVGAAIVVEVVQLILAKRAQRSRPRNAAFGLFASTYTNGDVNCCDSVLIGPLPSESQSP